MAEAHIRLVEAVVLVALGLYCIPPPIVREGRYIAVDWGRKVVANSYLDGEYHPQEDNKDGFDRVGMVEEGQLAQ
jgi:hypothetical protein